MFKLTCINTSILTLILLIGILYYLNYYTKKENFLQDNISKSVILNARPQIRTNIIPYTLKEISCDDNSSGLCLNIMEINHAQPIII